MTFSETGLKPEILRAITEIGFETPTPVQEKTIPHLLSTQGDLVALAQTGTGKTAAFGLPLLHMTDTRSSKVQALVLCPTRELCLQISRDLETFSRYLPGFRSVAVYGGADMRQQIKTLRQGCQVVIGTPGRTHDLIRRGELEVNSIQWLVLDEADEMLTMGFKDEMDAILANTPDTKQTLLFSATMPAEIAEMTGKYLHNPKEISIGHKNSGAETVEHQYYVVQAKDKYEALKRIADHYPDCYAIVFCRTRIETKEVADKLMTDGYNADALHGDLSQAQRDYVMSRFRNKNLQILVATDVAARGLDVNELTHVINYSIPDDPEVYIHRSGRTGRAGKKGISVSIVNLKETGRLKQIEKFSRKKMERCEVPGGDQVCERQLYHLIDRVVNVEVNDAQIDRYFEQVAAKFGDMTREEVIKKFVSVEFNRFLAYYKDARDLNVKESKRKEVNGSSQSRGGRMAFTRLFINAGKKQNLSAPRLIGLINEYSRRRDIEIGKIDIQRKFSFFEIDARHADTLISALSRANLDGHGIQVDKVEDSNQSFGSSFGRSDFRRKDRRGEGGYNGSFKRSRPVRQR